MGARWDTAKSRVLRTLKVWSLLREYIRRADHVVAHIGLTASVKTTCLPCTFSSCRAPRVNELRVVCLFVALVRIVGTILTNGLRALVLGVHRGASIPLKASLFFCDRSAVLVVRNLSNLSI